MTRLLLIGRNGQVGWELQRALMSFGELTALDRTQLDLANTDDIRRTVRALKPNVVINASAYTAVDQAETETALAMAVNGTAPGILAEEARRLGALLIHYSTDYVFDGAKPTPYSETDDCRPLNEYGRTKRAGEEAITAAGGAHLILRTSWVYGARGKNFLRTMLRLMNQRDELRVVDDQRGAPTWSRAIAEATLHALAVWQRAGGVAAGVYHLTAGGVTSWHGFAQAILAHGLPARQTTVRLVPIKSADHASAARRPANSVLSNAKIAEQFGICLPDWQAMLRLCLDDMGNGGAG